MNGQQAQGTPQARRLRARRDGAAVAIAASPMGDEMDMEPDYMEPLAGSTAAGRGRLDLHGEGVLVHCVSEGHINISEVYQGVVQAPLELEICGCHRCYRSLMEEEIFVSMVAV